MMLYCFVQNYHWGKKGRNSEVALLAEGNRTDLQIDEEKPYAELWMGTHPSGPSVIVESGLLLIDWIQKNPKVLGTDVRARFGHLPFLFKVLSVDQALSIQAHPTKEHAKKLHSSNPDIYKDPNHKPEMAIALTRFEALCGFRPINELKKFLQEISELRFIIGEELVANFLSSDEANLQNALRKCFRALMSAPDDVVGNAITSFLSTLSTLDEPTRESLHADLVERLHSHYPGDVGVFGPFFFNYIILNPGDAIYLPANEPHAYLSGDCVECMACSDNVVRAGLTPKLKDIDTLCEMLSYICEPADAKLFTGSKEDDYTTVYKPSVPDFALIKIEVVERKQRRKSY
ncbi:mannose phosphate isomerase isoform X2 [Lycorma delicatula]|uniref:mannose phosphate isomerase isoform X2 n=1 Tax=Lycorma delicatula TaxID=130591 RepID=UPI003F511091